MDVCTLVCACTSLRIACVHEHHSIPEEQEALRVLFWGLRGACLKRQAPFPECPSILYHCPLSAPIRPAPAFDCFLLCNACTLQRWLAPYAAWPHMLPPPCSTVMPQAASRCPGCTHPLPRSCLHSSSALPRSCLHSSSALPRSCLHSSSASLLAASLPAAHPLCPASLPTVPCLTPHCVLPLFLLLPCALPRSQLCPGSFPAASLCPASLPTVSWLSRSLPHCVLAPGSETVPSLTPYCLNCPGSLCPASLPAASLCLGSLPAASLCPASLPTASLCPASLPTASTAQQSGVLTEWLCNSCNSCNYCLNCPGSLCPASLPAASLHVTLCRPVTSQEGKLIDAATGNIIVMHHTTRPCRGTHHRSASPRCRSPPCHIS